MDEMPKVTAGAPANTNAGPSITEKLEGLLERARERVPTLTTALLLCVFFVGLGIGWQVSKPFHRSANNAEWRASIASKSKAVADLIAKGDADAEAIDNAIIDELGKYDARLSASEIALAHAARDGACRINADGLRR